MSWPSAGSRGRKARCARQNGLTCWSPSHPETWTARIKIQMFSNRTRRTIWELSSDKLCWVSFADEDFQQAQFGFDVLVFVVLLRQWGAVLLLHVSMGTRQGEVTESLLWECLLVEKNLSTVFFLPSILPEELVLELFQVLAESLLLFSGLLELLHEFLSVSGREEIFRFLLNWSNKVF